MESTSEAGPRCPAHPAAAASFECPRCGDFRCQACVVDTPWGESACDACGAAGHLRYPLAWERGVDIFSTLRALIVDSSAVFGAMPEHAPMVWPMVFAVLVPWVGWVVPMMVALSTSAESGRQPTLLVGAGFVALVWIPGMAIVSTGLGAIALVAGTRAFGHGCSAKLALRASGYAQAMWALPWLGLPLLCLPSLAALGGAIVMLAAFIVIRGQSMSRFAQAHGGVPASRAKRVAALEMIASTAPWTSFLLPLVW